MDYYVTLADPARHLLHVRIHLSGSAPERDVQLPVWNALYQIRDFSQNLLWLRAQDESGRPLPVRQLDKASWRISHAESGAEVEYEIVADLPGPFGAQLTPEHAFLNLAEVLAYPTDSRKARATVTFDGVPAQWKVATAMARLHPGNTEIAFIAPDYDHLVDAPIEVSPFAEQVFALKGAEYRVVVDAPVAEYSLPALANKAQRIAAAATDWMQDRPFEHYLFIYHFSHNRNGGGMEHAESCAIDHDADHLQADPAALDGTTAHEFFHLWNVKRIRPASLEPVDYTRENYTRALWFSEGVTTTASNLILLRAGLMTPQAYLHELELQITSLQLRAARKTQSAEQSSLDAWLEKYPDYRRPERSISYYSKGELLGVMLDLEIRHVSGGKKSLRELFQWMNEHYARQGKFFDDSNGVREAAEAVTGSSFEHFFSAYVSGVEELPYNEWLNTVGLQAVQHETVVPVIGFETVRNFSAQTQVVSVQENSEAARMGIVPGDFILKVNGQQASRDLNRMLEGMRPGEIVRLTVQGNKGTRALRLTLGGREEQQVKVVELAAASDAQRARRQAWLRGEAEK